MSDLQLPFFQAFFPGARRFVFPDISGPFFRDDETSPVRFYESPARFFLKTMPVCFSEKISGRFAGIVVFRSFF